MIIFPNCKINIGLQILFKREDGFHAIETLFVPVKNLSDIVEIIESKQTQFHCTGLDAAFLSKNNLCVKAYQLLKQAYDLPPVAIHLHKCVPTGAGLGGGSSDAAFTILLLNQLFHLKIDLKQMKSYAQSLGSDCAFFIENKIAMGKEKGNVLTMIDVPKLNGKYIYIVKPPVYISTSVAYAHVIPSCSQPSMENLLSSPISLWKDLIINDFEKSIFPLYPELQKIKQLFYEQGAIYASMSGSGSSLYGIFDTLPEKQQIFPSTYFQWIGKLF